MLPLVSRSPIRSNSCLQTLYLSSNTTKDGLLVQYVIQKGVGEVFGFSYILELIWNTILNPGRKGHCNIDMSPWGCLLRYKR